MMGWNYVAVSPKWILKKISGFWWLTEIKAKTERERDGKYSQTSN